MTMQEEQAKGHATTVPRWVIMPGSVLSQREAKEIAKAKEKRKEDGSHQREATAEERKERQEREERYLGATKCN